MKEIYELRPTREQGQEVSMAKHWYILMKTEQKHCIVTTHQSFQENQTGN